MLKGLLYLEVFICVRSLLRVRYFVPFVRPCILVTCIVDLYGTELS